MLQELGHNLEIFQLYGEIFRGNPRIGEELMDVFAEIIVFWATSVHFLNHNRPGKFNTCQPLVCSSGMDQSLTSESQNYTGIVA